MIFNKQKRFLVFNDSLALGGTEKLLVSLLNHLIEKKCNVTLILPEQREDNVLLSQVSENVAIKYLYTKEDSAFARKMGEVKMIFRTKSFLKKKGIYEDDYDEVVCFKEGFYSKMFSEWQIPKTLWLHNILYVRKYEFNSLREKFAIWLNKKEVAKVQEHYASYDRIVCVSEACKQAYLNVIFDGSLPIQDIRIVPNGIDQRQVKELSTTFIPEGLSPSVTKFVLLTRDSPDKRIDRIITTSGRLKDEGYKFIVQILGVESELINTEIEKQELQEFVFLRGQVDNPYPYIKQSDWLICTSERESFSLAIVEAMTLGVPIITTDCGGPTNITEKGKYGILVENSTEGVYDGMKSVLEDKKLAEKYSLGLEKTINKYKLEDWLKTVGKLLSL